MQRQRIQMQLQGRTQALTLSARPGPTLASTRAWSGLPIELHRMETFRGPEISAGPLEQDFGVLVVLDGTVEITTRCGTHVRSELGEPGAFKLLSGDVSRRVTRVTGSANVAAINVSPAWLAQVEREHRDLRAMEFTRDATVHAFACAMRDEVARGAAHGQLFSDTLSLGLIGHLTGRYGARRDAQPARGKLTGAQRERVRALIHAELDSDLSLTRLSAEARVSPRHFVNLFRATFGTSPHRYVLQLRVQAGAQRLLRGERDLAQIALALGFASQSHFTTAFRRASGLPPARFARLSNPR